MDVRRESGKFTGKSEQKKRSFEQVLRNRRERQ